MSEVTDKTDTQEDGIQKLLDRIAIERLEDILKAVADGITVQDQNGRIVFANLAAAKSLGFESSEEFLKTPVKDIFGSIEMLDESGNLVQPDELPGRLALKGIKTSKKVIKWINKKTGGMFWSEVSAGPVLDENGHVLLVVNVMHDITERKKFEAELDRNLRRNRHILDSIADSFIAVSNDFKVLDLNKAAENFIQKTRQEMVGKNLIEMFPQALKSIDFANEAIEKRVHVNFDEYYPETSRWVNFDLFPIREGVAVYFRDVTEQKHSEDIRLQLGAIIESSGDAIYSKDLNGTLTSWNTSAEKIYGYSALEAIGQHISLIIPADHDLEIEDILMKIKNGEKIDHFETVRRRKDGALINVSVSISPIKDDNGRIKGAAVIARDITERIERQAMIDLAAAESESARRNLDAMFMQAPALICILRGPEGTVELCNPMYSKLWGYREVVGKNMRQAWPELEGQGYFELIEKVYEGGEPVFGYEHPTMIDRQNDGNLSQGYFNFVYQPFRGADEKIQGVMIYGIEVTDQVMARQRLEESKKEVEESEERFRTMADSAPVLIWMADADGYCYYFNKQWLSFTGRTLDEEAGEAWIDNIHPDDKPALLKAFQDGFGKRQEYKIEYRLRRHDGQYRWVLSHGVPRFLPDGGFAGYIGSSVDIEDRKLAEHELQNSNRLSRDILASISERVPGLIAVYNIHNGKYIYVNDALPKLLGYGSQEFIEGGVLFASSLVHPDDIEQITVKNASVLKQANDPNRPSDWDKSVEKFEYRMRHKDGDYRWLQTYGGVFDRNDQGLVEHVMNISVDITDRKLAEEKLKALSAELEEKVNERTRQLEESHNSIKRSERNLNDFIDNATIGLHWADEDGKILRINQAELAMFGFASQEMAGRNIAEFIVEQEAIADILDQLKQGRQIKNRPVTIKTKSGATRFALINANGYWEDGKLIHTRWFVRDVTERRIAETSLKQRERRFRSLIEYSNDGVVLLSEQAIITYASNAITRILGYELDEFVGRNGFELMHPEDREVVIPVFLKLLQNEPDDTLSAEYRYLHKDGSWRWIEAHGNNLLKQDGVNAIVVNYRDITDSKKQRLNQEFFARIGKIFSASSLDSEATLKSVANACVPELADWCVIDVIQDAQRRRLAVAHRDLEKASRAFSQTEASQDFLEGVSAVISSGKSELYRTVRDENLKAWAKSGQHLEFLQNCQIKSALIVPIKFRNQIFGAITLISSDPTRIYDQTELSAAEELGRVSGTFIENSRLYESALKEIEERKKAEEEKNVLLKEVEGHQRRLNNIFATVPGVVWEALGRPDEPDQKTNFVSDYVETMLGYSVEEWLAEPNFWLKIVHPDDKERAAKEAAAIFESGTRGRSEFRWVTKDGRVLWVDSQSIVIKDKNGVPLGMRGVNMDVSQRKIAEELSKQAQDQMKYAFHHDLLTDLPNRVLFNEKLSQELAYSQANNKMLALMIIDLDRFKLVNESLGHAIGDRLIQEVGLRLSNCLNEEDMLARLGGDEFGILITDIDREEEVGSVCQRILDSLKHPFVMDMHELYVTPSLGITLFPYDGEDVSTLLKNADSALYRAKEQGRNNFQFYNPSMNATSFQQLTMENTLRRALKNEEFVVYYQPQIDVETGKIIEVEALIRWMHPDLGLVFPDEFIKIAEVTGLIEPIGDWVLRSALTQVRKWHMEGHDIDLSVNLSARQFKQRHMVRSVRKIISETGFDPKKLEFELTESVLVDNSTTVFNTLTELKKDGIKFAIDDFNTGYSSLNYIKRFPIDILKIDKSFVKGLPLKDKDVAIANSIINLAHSLGMLVVAEGVERTEQLNFLRDRKCDKAQGYLFSPPVDALSLTAMIEKVKGK